MGFFLIYKITKNSYKQASQIASFGKDATTFIFSLETGCIN
jgi:hypothetical protein